MRKFISSLVFIGLTAVFAYSQTPTPTTTPMQLPDDVPPIAPNFQAPVRPLPAPDRVGVDVANQLPITLQDAIRLALENNTEIETSKKDVEIAEFNLRAADGIYDPNIFRTVFMNAAQPRPLRQLAVRSTAQLRKAV